MPNLPTGYVPLRQSLHSMPVYSFRHWQIIVQGQVSPEVREA